MPEYEEKMQAVRVSYTCDACKKGDMKCGDLMLPTDPPRYPHKCLRCGSVANLSKPYPVIEYRDI